MLTATYVTDLGLGTVPDQVWLLPAGPFKASDGSGPFQVSDPGAVIRESLTLGTLAIDTNYSTILKGAQGEPSPAIGWINSIEWRPDGLWARVEWGDGRDLLQGRKYRNFGVMFTHDSGKQVQQIVRASLTSLPAQSSQPGAGQSWPSQQPGGTALAHAAGNSAALSAVEREVCSRLGIDPAAFIAQRTRNAMSRAVLASASGSVRTDPLSSYGLSQIEQNVASRMGIPHMAFAAQKLAAQKGEPIYKLTEDEQAICRRMGIAFKDYAVSKGLPDPEQDPLFRALPPEAMNLCRSLKMDPREFAVWWHQHNTAGTSDGRTA